MIRSNAGDAGGSPAVSRSIFASALRSTRRHVFGGDVERNGDRANAGLRVRLDEAPRDNGSLASSTHTACMAGVPGLTWTVRSAAAPNVSRAKSNAPTAAAWMAP